jgi:glutathione synthase/RimK-type ligase-like ATP-grasp enzyme
MILLWGLRHEAPMAAVLHALTRRGVETVMIDQRAYPTVAGSLTAHQHGASGWISVAGCQRPIDEFSGYFLRPYPIPPRYRHGLTLHQVAAIDQMMLIVAETAPAHIAVVNRPSAMASNDSKPAQLAQLEDLGFLVPDTIVTNDRQVAEDFWARHGTVVYKSTSGIRSIANILTSAHRNRLDRLATCPTQFQEFIPGIDYRVHVVGDEVFATQIISTATDYRYAATQAAQRTMAAAQLPDHIADQCCYATRELRLLLAGIDLRRTPDGDWYCFEVNTAPAFSWFQDHTGQPIADAVAALLQHGAHTGTTVQHDGKVRQTMTESVS